MRADPLNVPQSDVRREEKQYGCDGLFQERVEQNEEMGRLPIYWHGDHKVC